VTQQLAISTSGDVVRFLEAQHAEIKQLFEEVIARMGSQRQVAFARLRWLLAVHETAEEAIVHPHAARRAGGDVVAARRNEEDEARAALARLEELDIESTEFEAAFRELQRDVTEHATAEESEEFPQLDGFAPEELSRLRPAAELAYTARADHTLPADTRSATYAAMVVQARSALHGDLR